MRSTLTRLISSTLIVGLLVCGVISGCSKKTETAKAGGSGLVDEALLKRIPPSSAGFFVVNTTLPGYKRFLESPWGKNTKGLASLSQTLTSQTSQADVAKGLVEVLDKLGLNQRDPSKGPVLQKAIGFIAPRKDATPDAGVLAIAASDVDLSTLPSQIQSSIKDPAFTITPLKVAGVDGATIKIKTSGGKSGTPSETTLYLASNKDTLALSTNETITGDLLSGKEDAALSQLVASDSFKRATQAIPHEGDEYAFGYLEFDRLIDSIQVPPAQAEQVKNLPIGGIAISQQMGDSPYTAATLGFAPKTESQKKVLHALKSDGSHELITKFGSDTLAFVGLNGKPLAEIRANLMSELSPDQQGAAGAFGPMVDSLKSLGIGIQNAGTGSPFPEITIVAQSDQSEGIVSMLTSMIGGALASSGLPMGDWQSKDIQGVPVKYVFSPLGVGLFIANSDDTIIIGTSEPAITKVLTVAKAGSGSLLERVPSNSQKDLKATNPLMFVFLDFPKVAAMIETAQSNLAMFTGGKTNFDNAKIQELKAWGNLALSMQFKQEDVLTVESRYSAPS